MMINCDIGERGISHPVDLQLMNYIDIANIACGGHAGDRQSAAFFRDMARGNGVKVCAHLSYPDRENFGRKTMAISSSDLSKSLDEQYGLLKGSESVKLHGALYNNAATQKDLAEFLADWFAASSVSEVLCPPCSELALACIDRKIGVLEEAFAERTYTWDSVNAQLILTPRTEAYAHLSTVKEAWEQYEQLVERKSVSAFYQGERKEYPLKARTLCIHSDSPIALELAKRIKADGQSPF